MDVSCFLHSDAAAALYDRYKPDITEAGGEFKVIRRSLIDISTLSSGKLDPQVSEAKKTNDKLGKIEKVLEKHLKIAKDAKNQKDAAVLSA